MKLHFLGANRQVTGSRYLIEAAGKKIVVDCGLFQEREFSKRNWEKPPFAPEAIDAVVLTHVHIDHCGLLPRLVRHGLQCPIYATRASTGLAEVVLLDSARIQTEDAAYKKRRHRKEGRKGKHPEVPLYKEQDALDTLKLLKPVPYHKPLEIAEEFQVTFFDAGHILGSAMIQVDVTEHGKSKRVVFSGDIGQPGKPLIRDPEYIDRAEYVVMESTYGDRDHQQGGDIQTQIQDVINRTVNRGGDVIIPTFAVERAQELMYYIGRLVHSDRIPDIRVYLDSPMAIDVTQIFREYRDCLDAETWELINSDEPPLHFPGLKMCRTVDESRSINAHRMPSIIMATSGMCTAGRIKHHLRHGVGRPENTVLFVGYQAHGTLGRQILDGNQEVRIHGRNWPVRAEIAQIYGFSGHADQGGLLDWLSHFDPPPQRVFLTHGEEEAAATLSKLIQQRSKSKVSVPEYQQVFEV